MSISIINADGTTGVIDIPEGANLDTKRMGLLSNEEVGAFKTKYLNQGKESVSGDLQTLRQEKEAAEQKLQALNDSLSNKDKSSTAQAMQIETLQKTLDNLSTKFEQKDKEAAQLQFQSKVRDTASELQLIPSAFSILETHVQAKAVEGGFMAADGSTTDLKGVIDEWAGSEIGKRLTLSGERGGAGTSPDSFSGQTFADYHNAGKQSEYIEKFGREKYLKESNAHRRSQKTA